MSTVVTILIEHKSRKPGDLAETLEQNELHLTVRPQVEAIDLTKILPKLKADIEELGLDYGFEVKKGKGW